MTGRTRARARAEDVARLASEGFGRNACARELGVSRRAIDDAAREAGVTWVRSSTEAATKARLIDRRAELLEDFSVIADLSAERLIRALEDDVLDPETIKALVSAIGTSGDKFVALADRIEGEGHDDLESVRVWVNALTTQIQAANRGLIERDENGNFPLILSADQIPRDHAEPDRSGIEVSQTIHLTTKGQ